MHGAILQMQNIEFEEVGWRRDLRSEVDLPRIILNSQQPFNFYFSIQSFSLRYQNINYPDIFVCEISSEGYSQFFLLFNSRF